MNERLEMFKPQRNVETISQGINRLMETLTNFNKAINGLECFYEVRFIRRKSLLSVAIIKTPLTPKGCISFHLLSKIDFNNKVFVETYEDNIRIVSYPINLDYVKHMLGENEQ